MESPVKKLDFNVADKENKPVDDAVSQEADQAEVAHKLAVDAPKKVEAEEKPKEQAVVAAGIKAHEADEPLLQENPQRFVLFPIKYHEVSDAFRTR